MEEFLKGLPGSVQVAVFLGVGVGTALVAVLGYLKPKLAKTTDDQKNSDAVVISASFADSRVIDRLTVAIDQLKVAADKMTEASEEVMHVTESLTKSVNYATEEMRTLTRELIRGTK